MRRWIILRICVFMCNAIRCSAWLGDVLFRFFIGLLWSPKMVGIYVESHLRSGAATVFTQSSSSPPPGNRKSREKPLTAELPVVWEYKPKDHKYAHV